MGAYRSAQDAFATHFPEASLAFFAMRGPVFLMGQMDAAGVFHPKFRDDADRVFTKDVNGAEAVDTSAYDNLLLIGHRFGFNNIASLLEHHDILEGARTGRAHLMGQAMVEDTIIDVTEKAVDSAVASIAAFDRPATFAMAPYPARSILERGDDYALARLLRIFWEHPDAAWVFERWLAEVVRALEAKGHRLLAQPEPLCAGPFATKSEFAARAAGFGDATLAKTDHRHMNADFGLAMLCAYAENHLGLVPHPGDATPPNERIA